MTKAQELQKQKIMVNLELTAEQADEVLAYDKQVDQNAPQGTLPYDLNAEQRKVAKSASATGTSQHKKPIVLGQSKNPRKPDEEKEKIVKKVAEWLAEQGFTAVNIENPNRLVAFSAGNVNYTLTLTKKR